MREFDTDVIVVGGGPGGAAAATMLTRKGWRVRLYERDHFPREHVGESLLPASMPVLAELGVLPAVEAAVSLTGGCNSVLEFSGWGHEAEGLTGAGVQFQGDAVQVLLAVR